MKLLTGLKWALLAAQIFFLGACSDSMDGDDNDVMKVSQQNTFDSHNAGQVCQNCHKSGGSGEGIFAAAGTVYHGNNLDQVYPNVTIHIYTQPNGQGTLVKTIEVDGRGNFYTTENINWGTGLYPAVSSPMGTIYMNTSIDRGNCNSCHDNVTESHIYAN